MDVLQERERRCRGEALSSLVFRVFAQRREGRDGEEFRGGGCSWIEKTREKRISMGRTYNMERKTYRHRISEGKKASEGRR